MKTLPAVDVKLLVRAGNELIRWRRHWERKYGEPPTVDNGQADEMRIWTIAGELMDAVGERRRMP